jgi:hypothetical protein
MRARADAIGGAEDLGSLAPSEDAPSASPAMDAQIPDEAVRDDSGPPDARIPDAVLDPSALADGNLPFEVARIVRVGTNFGPVTVVVYSDASAVRTREESMIVRELSDAAREPSIEVLPPGSPEVVKFLEDLASVDNVAVLGGWDSWCPGQSISFSTRTYLTAGGMTSRNLECGEGATVSDPVLTADCVALAS